MTREQLNDLKLKIGAGFISGNTINELKEKFPDAPDYLFSKMKRIVMEETYSDDFLNAFKMYKEGGKAKDIAPLCNMKVTTFYNTVTDYSLYKEIITHCSQLEETPVSQPVSSPVSNDNNESFVWPPTEWKVKKQRMVLEVGMINRKDHDFPASIKGFVISDSSIEDSFNYSLIDSKVQEFLLNRVGFNDKGEPFKDLVVYCTGLTCVTASIIKMCGINKVNLTLMHYRYEMQDFIPQVIYKDFQNGINNEDLPLNVVGNIYYHDKKDIKGSFYSVKLSTRESVDSKNANLKFAITKSETEALEIFKRNLVNIYKNNTELCSLYLAYSTIENFNEKSTTQLRAHNYVADVTGNYYDNRNK